MRTQPELPLDTPIPGQSLTAPFADRPWQNPPQLSTVNEAMEHYIPMLTNKETLPQLLNILEIGIPITTIADSLMLANVMEGIHSVDVGILIIPFIVEMLQFIAESQGVEYVVEKPKSSEGVIPDFSDIAVAAKRLEDKDGNNELSDNQEVMEEQIEETKGLMSRSVK